MKKILINGDFLCRPLTGIERYAYEITMRLDKLITQGEIAVIVPKNVTHIPNYQNLLVIKHTANYKSHIVWQMISLQSFLIVNRKFILLEYANTCLPFAPTIVFLHDIYCHLFPNDFVTFREKLARIYNEIQYKLIAKRAVKIFTVSSFCKKQIVENFNVKPEMIHVVYNSWEHFCTVEPDCGIFSKFPFLKNKQFYFSLGSLSKRKNIKWIIEYAAKHKNETFAVSGASISLFKIKELQNSSLPENIILLGYLHDPEVKMLMQTCKAFLFPSYYEGFGIPPLEALSCGAKVIASNTASLPEILGDSAFYIEADNTDIDLNTVLQKEVRAPEETLKKFSWDMSAKKVYDVIMKR